MMKKHCAIILIFSCFALNACAKSENINAPFVGTEDVLFATRTPILNDQQFDIDGDGKSDVIEIVTISKRAQLPPSVSVVSPWAKNDEKVKENASLAGGSQNNLLVSFGNEKKFLIHDVNAVSLLDTEAAKEIFLIKKVSLAELEIPDFSEQPTGDVIVIPTEAGIDTYLYWNGSRFQAYEPLELP